MGERYATQQHDDRDRDEYDYAPSYAPQPRSRSQVRIRVPDSVIGDDVEEDMGGRRARFGDDPRQSREDADFGASEPPALRRRKSVDLERKTTKENEDFRKRRNELEAQEAELMRRDEGPGRYGRGEEGPRGGGRYEDYGRGGERSMPRDDDEGRKYAERRRPRDDDDRYREDERRRPRIEDESRRSEGRRSPPGFHGKRATGVPDDAVSYGSDPVGHLRERDRPATRNEWGSVIGTNRPARDPREMDDRESGSLVSVSSRSDHGRDRREHEHRDSADRPRKHHHHHHSHHRDGSSRDKVTDPRDYDDQPRHERR